MDGGTSRNFRPPNRNAHRKRTVLTGSVITVIGEISAEKSRMRKISLQQIVELPEREKRQLKAHVNHSLGSLYERYKCKQEGKMIIELGEDNERERFETEQISDQE